MFTPRGFSPAQRYSTATSRLMIEFGSERRIHTSKTRSPETRCTILLAILEGRPLGKVRYEFRGNITVDRGDFILSIC
jgi:hypothetical protein